MNIECTRNDCKKIVNFSKDHVRIGEKYWCSQQCFVRDTKGSEDEPYLRGAFNTFDWENTLGDS